MILTAGLNARLLSENYRHILKELNGTYRILMFSKNNSPLPYLQAFLQSVSVTSVKAAIEEGLKKNIISINKSYGSITVEIWDGHYFDDEHPSLPVRVPASQLHHRIISLIYL